MRSKLVIYLVVAVLAAAALAVGIVAVAGAGQTNPLAATTAPDLLAKMQQQAGQTKNVNGDVAWQNNLLGDLSAVMGSSSFGGSAKLPLVANGSGRVWVGQDGMRIESQASGGDQVVVVNGTSHDAWTFDYAANTATHYVMTGAPSGGGTPSPAASPSMPTPATITAFLERLAPLANVQVTGQSIVAGRDVYLMTMTPTAPDTALGSVQAAIDGQTSMPLQLQVFAKGDATPVLRFGFTSVSFDAIPASTFAFTPPAGATVTTKNVDLGKMTQGQTSSTQSKQADPTKAQQTALQKIMQSALLTVPEAQKLVPYTLYAPQASYKARPFDMAAVLDKGGPLTAVGTPVMELLKASGLGAMMGGQGAMGGAPVSPKVGAAGSATASMGPTTVLVYGKGFGTIVLAEAQSNATLDKQIKQLPAIVDTTPVNGAMVRWLTTPLGGVAIWQKGDTTLVAGGMVPKADLQAFVASVQ